jgi:flagellar protein FlaG
VAPPEGMSIGPVAAVTAPPPSGVSAPPGDSAAALTRTAATAPPANAPSAAALPAGAAMLALRAAVEKITAQLRTAGQSLRLTVDADYGRMVVVVRDTETGTVLRQMPSEELLRLASTPPADARALVDLMA